MTEKSILDRKLQASDIESLFEAVLGRSCGDAAYIDKRLQTDTLCRALLQELLNCDEFMAITREKDKKNIASKLVNDAEYRIPTHLRRTDVGVTKVLLVGSCLMDSWLSTLETHFSNTQFERIIFNNASDLPEINAEKANNTDFQIVQIPLRSIMPEALYFSTKFTDQDSHEKIFRTAIERLLENFNKAVIYAHQHNITTFVLGFVTPQQNPAGRLQDRYTLNNMIYFIECLNRELYQMVSNLRGMYFVDFDQIVANFGKRYFQDDSVVHLNHASILGGIAMGSDNARLEPIGSIIDEYAPRGNYIVKATFQEIEANYRSIRGLDTVKLVVFDLDDTLWRGVAAEQDVLDPFMIEGWPIGMLEAAAYLWKRGIMLAIVSKNDQDNVTKVWKALYGTRFDINNFVELSISWQSKAEAILQIISDVNVLPDSVLFIDDNPVERAAALSAIPGLRTIDANLIHWRRILLWSAETQPLFITEESSNRTDMVHAQLNRVKAEASTNREHFLSSLHIKLTTHKIYDSDDKYFPRLLELLNKTNQFNSTGKRWSEQEMNDFFSDLGVAFTFDVEDVFTPYGMTFVALVHDNLIVQIVMSCRVFGMRIEDACMAVLGKHASSNNCDTLALRFIRTGRNTLVEDFFNRIGKPGEPDLFVCQCAGFESPAHIRVSARS